MADIDFSPLAEDTLSTFSEIADNATDKLRTENSLGTDSFASGNTLTGNQAFANKSLIESACSIFIFQGSRFQIILKYV